MRDPVTGKLQIRTGHCEAYCGDPSSIQLTVSNLSLCCVLDTGLYWRVDTIDDDLLDTLNGTFILVPTAVNCEYYKGFNAPKQVQLEGHSASDCTGSFTTGYVVYGFTWTVKFASSGVSIVLRLRYYKPFVGFLTIIIGSWIGDVPTATTCGDNFIANYSCGSKGSSRWILVEDGTFGVAE
ncbi:MAG: hypothetical protein FVQ82_13030 [Planctomycetes bacterium]|nr:hypothetical protein [Planctomycetota bacterium]